MAPSGQPDAPTPANLDWHEHWDGSAPSLPCTAPSASQTDTGDLAPGTGCEAPHTASASRLRKNTVATSPASRRGMLSWADEPGEAHAPPPTAAREVPETELQAPSPKAGAVIAPTYGAPNALGSDHTIDQSDFLEHLSDEDISCPETTAPNATPPTSTPTLTQQLPDLGMLADLSRDLQVRVFMPHKRLYMRMRAHTHTLSS